MNKGLGLGIQWPELLPIGITGINGAKTHQAEQGSGLWEPTEGHLELQELAWC